MFNKNLKVQAIEQLEKDVKDYDELLNEVVAKSKLLLLAKSNTVKHIKLVESHVNTLANKPMSFHTKLNEISINRKSFDQEIEKIQVDQKKVEKKASIQVGAGVAAGVGVAALGPTAAMAIATTFGTASTGTAIASLSGAAASHAALAWLGGGTLAAGGSGMAGGSAFLALAGPLGLTIGGVSIAGASVLASSKNKKMAIEAERESRNVRNEMSRVRHTRKMIDTLKLQLIDFLRQSVEMLKDVVETYPNDYSKFSREQKEIIGVLVNNTHSMSKLINQKVVK